MADASQQSNADSVLGRLVVERGFATAEEVSRCLNRQEEAAGDSDPKNRSLGQLLIEEGLATPKQIERLMPEIDAQKATQQIPGYKIMGKLGAGAMAVVYKARQISLDRMVAIKVLPKKYAKNQQFIERFYAEGKAAAKLNHPNIVGALDVGHVGDTHYFVMEYVDGASVYEHLVAHGRYDEGDAIRVGMETAEALDHSHKAGFIHRDVKPKNIMITQEGVVKLADMGLARAVSDREAAEAEAGKAFGTPYYISPEQIRGEIDVDFRADIYGLGCTLYHMVTGQVPFDGPNPSAVMHKHLKTDPIPPDHLNPSLTTGISEVIEVAMAKDRNKRYATTEDLLDDLKAIAAGEPPIQARKLFDIASLAGLEAGEEVEPSARQMNHLAPAPLTATPLFWVAASGWAIALLLVVVLVAISP